MAATICCACNQRTSMDLRRKSLLAQDLRYLLDFSFVICSKLANMNAFFQPMLVLYKCAAMIPKGVWSHDANP